MPVSASRFLPVVNQKYELVSEHRVERWHVYYNVLNSSASQADSIYNDCKIKLQGVDSAKNIIKLLTRVADD